MIQEEWTFTAINTNGEEANCTVLFSFEYQGNNVVVYTDGTWDAIGETVVYANLLSPSDNSLLPINDKKIWTIIELIISEYNGE